MVGTTGTVGFVIIIIIAVTLCLLLQSDRVCAFQPSTRHQEGIARRDNSRNERRPSATDCVLSSSIRLASDDSESRASSSESSSIAQALDPSDARARSICLDTIHLAEEQYDKVCQLATLVCEWNEKLNLVSRKDCNEATVFARHILPCLAMYNKEGEDDRSIAAEPSDVSSQPTPPHLFQPKSRVMDVGTGGGFPGLPLAIQYPDTQFVLADSVGKKIASVADMAALLKLSNVRTYHGRVEEYFAQTQLSSNTEAASTTQTSVVRDGEKFDVITGRSVTSLPQFCAWVQHLLKPKTGHLVYWIGGEIDPTVLPLALCQTNIETRIPGWTDDSDKKVLIFTASAVRTIAASSGIKITTTKTRKSVKLASKDDVKSSKRLPKGAWQKKKEGPRQRGFENFQRYSSNTGMTENVGGKDAGTKNPVE